MSKDSEIIATLIDDTFLNTIAKFCHHAFYRESMYIQMLPLSFRLLSIPSNNH